MGGQGVGHGRDNQAPEPEPEGVPPVDQRRKARERLVDARLDGGVGFLGGLHPADEVLGHQETTKLLARCLVPFQVGPLLALVVKPFYGILVVTLC